MAYLFISVLSYFNCKPKKSRDKPFRQLGMDEANYLLNRPQKNALLADRYHLIVKAY